MKANGIRGLNSSGNMVTRFWIKVHIRLTYSRGGCLKSRGKTGTDTFIDRAGPSSVQT